MADLKPATLGWERASATSSAIAAFTMRTAATAWDRTPTNTWTMPCRCFASRSGEARDRSAACHPVTPRRRQPEAFKRLRQLCPGGDRVEQPRRASDVRAGCARTPTAIRVAVPIRRRMSAFRAEPGGRGLPNRERASCTCPGAAAGEVARWTCRLSRHRRPRSLRKCPAMAHNAQRMLAAMRRGNPLPKHHRHPLAVWQFGEDMTLVGLSAKWFRATCRWCASCYAGGVWIAGYSNEADLVTCPTP